MSFESDESVAQELKMYVDNDGDLYRQQTQPIFKNLITKMARGDYDHDKAVLLFMYLAENGAKKYAQEFGGDSREWHTMFPINIRRAVAITWRDEFERSAKEGEYDHLKPKKYQKAAPAKKAKRKSR